MGNTASSEQSSVKSLSDAELTRLAKTDDECAILDDQLFDPSVLAVLDSLDSYQVAGARPRQESTGSVKLSEIAAAFVQGSPVRLADKFQDLKSALLQELRTIRAEEEDDFSKDLKLRRQAICRLHDALVRQDEREARRIAAVKKPEASKSAKPKKSLPVFAKVGIEFGLGALLDLIRVVGRTNPELYRMIVTRATAVLADLPPMCLNTEDSTILKAVEDVSAYFEEVLRDPKAGVSEEDQLCTLSPLLALALAKGNLTSALSVALKFFTMASSPSFLASLTMIAPILNSFGQLKGASLSSRINFNWNAGRLGPDIALSNNNLTITRTDSSGWGCNLSEQSLTSGVHYVEFKVDRNSSSCLLLGVAGSQFNNYSSKSSGAHCYTIQSDGDAYMNDRSSGNVFRFSENDRLGLVINMEDKTLTFFLNGRKQSQPPFGPLPEEVFILACFGGSNQFVTLSNEAELPEAALEMISTVSFSVKKDELKTEEGGDKEVGTFPTKAAEILANSAFLPLSTEGSDLGAVTPCLVSVYLLACLDNLNSAYFEPFRLNEKPSSEPVRAKFSKQNGLSFNIQPATFRYLMELGRSATLLVQAGDFSAVDYKLCIWTVISTLRMLRSHIFAALFLKLGESDTGLDTEQRLSLHSTIQTILTLSPVHFTGPELTKEDTDALGAMQNEASLTLAYGFEVFYPTEGEKLDYLITSLETRVANKPIHPTHQNIQSLLLEKMSTPMTLSPALSVESDENLSKVSLLLNTLLDICKEQAYKKLSGSTSTEFSLMLRLLKASQKVLFSKAARNKAEPRWEKLVGDYAGRMLAIGEELLAKVRELCPEGFFTKETESQGRGTLIEYLLSSLLLSLTVMKPTKDLVAKLMPGLMRMAQFLNNFTSEAPEIQRGNKVITEIYESEHPYPNSARLSHVIQIPGAKRYTLLFDPSFRTEKNYDYLELWLDMEKKNKHSKWTGTEFPTEPLVVENSLLHFAFTSDDSTNFWGWRIEVKAEVDISFFNSSWMDHLRTATNALIVTFSQQLISGGLEAAEQPNEALQAILRNKLLKAGIHDKCHCSITGSKPELSSELVQLSKLTFKPGKETHGLEGSLRRAVSLDIPKKMPSTSVLSSYLSNFSAISTNFAQYSEIKIIEDFIKGNEKLETAWQTMKKEAGVTGPVANIGGLELAKAERALFSVFAVFFDFAHHLPQVFDDPEDLDESLKFVIRQTCQMRKWAQQQKQKLMDNEEHKEISYVQIQADILQKCTLLLNSEHKKALQELGVSSIKVTPAGPLLAKAYSVDPSTLPRVEHRVERGSPAKSGSALSKIKTLLTISGPTASDEDQVEKKDFKLVTDLIYELLNSPATAGEIVALCSRRRDMAISRAIGLNYLVEIAKNASIDNVRQVESMVSAAFSESLLNTDRQKVHYLAAVEGIDPTLLSCLQRSFFTMYQLLLERLNLVNVKSLDCTSDDVSSTFLVIMEGLSFPFEDLDAMMLFDLNVRNAITFLLTWAKGLKIYEKVKYKFDPSKCVTQLKVFNEREYSRTDEEECFSLNVKNRLDGDVEEEEEDAQQFCLQVLRGKPETQPITDLVVAVTQPEGYEEVPGNVNERGEQLQIYVKREAPLPGRRFLTKLSVTGIEPIRFETVYTPYADLQVQDQTQEDEGKRSTRRERLRKAAWTLFKLLLYSCCGKPDGKSADSQTTEAKKAKLQEMFTDVLLQEVKWSPAKEKLEAGGKEAAALRLRKVCSGDLWLTEEINKAKLAANPMVEWTDQLRDLKRSLEANSDLDAKSKEFVKGLYKAVKKYVTLIDPTCKGAVALDESLLERVGGSAQELQNFLNSEGEVDFFTYLNWELTRMVSVTEVDISLFPLLSDIPSDFTQAKERYDLGNVNGVLKRLQAKMNPNEDHSFAPYLIWFDQLSQPDKPGLIHSTVLPEPVPSEFINANAEFDFFLALNVVKANPGKFPDFWRELKAGLADLEGLANSCSELYTPQKSHSSLSDYTASLLWTMYQCCGSKSFKEAVARSGVLLELLKHAFVGMSEVISTISCRIVRSIVSSGLQPETVSDLWTRVPKDLMLRFMPESSTRDIVNALFTYIGLKASAHLKPKHEFVPNYSKISQISHESLEFLRCLHQTPAWSPLLHSLVLEKIVSFARSPLESVASSYEEELGVLSFLSTATGVIDSFDRNVLEWTVVEMENSGVAVAHVVKVNPKTGMLTLYSEDDEEIHKESLNNLGKVFSAVKGNFCASFKPEESTEMFELLLTLVEKSEDAQKAVLDTVEGTHSFRAVWRQAGLLALQALHPLASERLVLQSARLAQVASTMFSRTTATYEKKTLSVIRCRNLRRHLYHKHKESLLTTLKAKEDVAIEIEEKKEEEDHSFKYMTEEEENKLIQAMSEENMMLVVCLKSMGFSFPMIQQAMKEGKTDMDSVTHWITEKREADDKKSSERDLFSSVKCLYKLHKSEIQEDQVVVTDNSGTADCSQLPSGYLAIASKLPCDEVKSVTLRPNLTFLRSLNEFLPEITVFATIGYRGLVVPATFGFSLGNISLKIRCDGSIFSLYNRGSAVYAGEARRNYSFKIYVRFDGKATITDETDESLYSLVETEVEAFDGLSIGDFGVFMEAQSSGSVALKGFIVYQGRYAGGNSYWEEEADSKAESQKKEEDGHFIDVKLSELNLTALRLGLTSAPKSVIDSYISVCPKYDEALTALLAREDSSLWPEEMRAEINAPIADVMAIETFEDLEEGFEVIPVYDGFVLTHEYQLEGMKMIAIKRAAEGQASHVFEVAYGEDKAEYTKMGDVTLKPAGEVPPTRFPNPLSALKLSRTKSVGKSPLTGLIFVLCTDPKECKLPAGYQLLMHEKLAVNFGEKASTSYIFLAYQKNALLFDCPILSLNNLKKKVSEYGLVDSFEPSTKEDTSASDMKRLDDEMAEYSKYSLVELHSRTLAVEQEIASRLAKDLFLRLVKVWPGLLESLVSESTEKFNGLMRLVGEDFCVLESPLKAVLTSDKGALLGHRLLEECISQFSIASTLVASAIQGSPKEQVFQSTHPYENNMRFDQTVKIPGAVRLRVEFDSQCHTESGCDILRFFRSPNHADQICEYSGKSFSDLEVEGDTFHLYFYSDGSCVEWGYCFRVIPIFLPTSGKVDPQLKRLNVESALWVLENLVLSYDALPMSLVPFTRREMLHPLNVFVHSTDNDAYRIRALRIVKSLFVLSEKVPLGTQAILHLLIEETKSLYNSEKSQKSISSLMQSFLTLIMALKDHFQIEFVEKWFQEFADAVALMSGLYYRDEKLHPILLDQFKLVHKVSFDITRESQQHPYSKKPSTKKIHIKGANYLEIEFDEKSALDPQDAFYFSYDMAGKEPVEAEVGMASTEAGWANDPKGPDITFSNSNKSVTRTNSSGWGCAVWSESYSHGKVKITFHIDNDGGSEYLYIGVFKADTSYSLSDVTNSENSRELWTWKTVGEFHRHGESVKNSEGRYRTGDDVSFLLDMDEHTVAFAKNGVDLHTFPNLAAEVIPCICFGGSNQHVTVSSVEVLGASTAKLSKKKVVVNGDIVYYHFPINSGYLAQRNRLWRLPQGKPKQITYSGNGIKLKRTAGLEGRYSALVVPQVETARHYCEFQVLRLSQGKVQLGLVLANTAATASLSEGAAIESTGLVSTNTRESQAEAFAQGDTISMYADMEKKLVRFYKNGNAISAFLPVNLEAGKAYCFAACLDSEGQELAIVKHVNPPEELDMLGTRQDSAGQATNWGYKFKVSPVFIGKNRMNQLMSLNEKQLEKWQLFQDHYKQTFTRQIDEQVVQYVDDFCMTSSKDPLKLDPAEINPKREDMLQYSALENLAVPDLRETFMVLVRFNRQVEKILPMISLDLTTNSRDALDEIQRLFLSVRSFIFYSLKSKLFKEVLRTSNTDSRPEVPLDRTKAMRQKSNGRVDSQGMISVFGQLYRQLDKLNHKSVRNSERMCKVILKGEGATDAGGPYNEVISTICDELQSRFLPLLVPTQNNLHNVGDSRDSWMPNPHANSKLHLALFTFFGKMLGVAIRTQNNLNLSLPPLFWKRLVMEEVYPSDLKSVDEITHQMLDILRHLEANDITEANFGDAFENVFFTTQDSSGRITELVEGGRERPVTYSTASEYADLVERKRLTESAAIYVAVRRGISAIVPINLLNMFNWKQVEVMVCGAPDINLDLFMKNTEYDGIERGAPCVGFFWEVLREFTPQQRSLFLRFVWGRSRLPASGDFRKFKLTRLNKGGNIDDYLPVSHTCFFQLDLPAYSTKEIMKDKLLYAITHCQAIDLDRIAEGGWEEEL